MLYFQKKISKPKDYQQWWMAFLISKNPRSNRKKLKSYLHHIDYDIDPIGINRIKKIVEDKKAIYDLKADQRQSKFNAQNELIKIDNTLLPSYILENMDKFEDWIEK